MKELLKEQINTYEQKHRYKIGYWDLYESMARGDKVIVIDARSVEAYADEHNPTAVNLSYRTMNEETTAELDRIWAEGQGMDLEEVCHKKPIDPNCFIYPKKPAPEGPGF